MPYSVMVVAKAGCTEQINELWTQAGFEGELIMTEAAAKKEVDFIQSPKGQPHLKYVKTVDDWNKTFPIMAVGTGMIDIGGLSFDKEENPDETARLTQQVQFVLDHRFLFQEIRGLDDARSALGMKIEGDFIDAQGKPRYHPVADFKELPARPTSKIFQACVQYDRPDIWAAYLAFEANQDEAAWVELRSKNIPWPTRVQPQPRVVNTVWQACEKTAAARDGKDFGLLGRFRDGKVPSMFELLQAIKPI